MKTGSHKCYTIFLTIVIPIIITSSKSIDWNINGQVQWARHCRFQGDHNIGQSFSTEEECGMVCMTISRCTHFVWLSDICFLKRIQGNHNIKLEPTDIPNSRCGSILDRSETSSSKEAEPSLLWQDEFDDFNQSRWGHIVATSMNRQAGYQFYTNHMENSFSRDGIMYIKPTLTVDRFEDGEKFLRQGTLDLTSEQCSVKEDPCTAEGNGEEIISPIASAGITTEKTFKFTFGTVEIRAKMPRGDWISSSISLLPVDGFYGEDIRSGAIQIVNVRGNKHLNVFNVPIGRQLAVSNIYWGSVGNDMQNPSFSTMKWNQKVDFSSDFHIFKLDWTEDGFKFFIDGEMIDELKAPKGGLWKLGNLHSSRSNGASSIRNHWASGTKMAPFDKPFYIFIDVNVGGTNDVSLAEWAKYKLKNDSMCFDMSHPMRNFWEKKDKWLRTWNGDNDDNALQIDYIRVYSP